MVATTRRAFSKELASIPERTRQRDRGIRSGNRPEGFGDRVMEFEDSKQEESAVSESGEEFGHTGRTDVYVAMMMTEQHLGGSFPRSQRESAKSRNPPVGAL